MSMGELWTLNARAALRLGEDMARESAGNSCAERIRLAGGLRFEVCAGPEARIGAAAVREPLPGGKLTFFAEKRPLRVLGLFLRCYRAGLAVALGRGEALLLQKQGTAEEDEIEPLNAEELGALLRCARGVLVDGTPLPVPEVDIAALARRLRLSFDGAKDASSLELKLEMRLHIGGACADAGTLDLSALPGAGACYTPPARPRPAVRRVLEALKKQLPGKP